MRIVSFLPSASEMVCALGLSNELVGVTHECDYPSEVRAKPAVVSSVLPLDSMTQSEIDAAVAERLRNGQSLYQVDETLLQDLAPDVIITQDLCQVCAPSGNELSQALRVLPKQPRILWMTTKSIGGIEANIRELGEATGRSRQAEELIAAGQAKLKTSRHEPPAWAGRAFSVWNGWIRFIAAVIGCRRWCGLREAWTRWDLRAPIQFAFPGMMCGNGILRCSLSCHAALTSKKWFRSARSFRPIRAGSIWQPCGMAASMPWMRMRTLRVLVRESLKARSCWRT